jgi:hypothetical protein
MAKKSSTILPINIELTFDDIDDLDSIYEQKVVIEPILENVLDIIEKAIKLKKNKVELFNIYNHSLVLSTNKDNYINILETIKEFYLKEEKYELCKRIQDLITKL